MLFVTWLIKFVMPNCNNLLMPLSRLNDEKADSRQRGAQRGKNQEQMKEMEWFIKAAKPFKGMEINVLSETVPTHYKRFAKRFA
jgi:hypothetical protein